MKAGFDRLDVPIVPEILKKSPFSHHLLCLPVITDAAGVLTLDAGGVPDMVDVTMGEEQGGNTVAVFREPIGDALRSVDQNCRVWQVKTVRIKDSAGIGVELHECMARLLQPPEPP